MSSIPMGACKTLKMLKINFIPGHWGAVWFAWCSNSCMSAQTLPLWDTQEHLWTHSRWRLRCVGGWVPRCDFQLLPVALERSDMVFCKCRADVRPVMTWRWIVWLPWPVSSFFTVFSLERKTEVSFQALQPCWATVSVWPKSTGLAAQV